MPAPYHLSKTGATVLDANGKQVKRFSSREKARSYMTARNLAWRRSTGRSAPARSRRRK